MSFYRFCMYFAIAQQHEHNIKPNTKKHTHTTQTEKNIKRKTIRKYDRRTCVLYSTQAHLGEGPKGPCPPRCQSRLFCLVYVCIYAVKLIKLILSVCTFREFSCSKNRLLPGLRPGDRLLPKKSTFVFGFRPQFLPLGG